MLTEKEIIDAALAEHGYSDPKTNSVESYFARDVAATVLRLAREQRDALAARTISRDNEPPVGTWVKDRHGGTSYRQESGGWGQPGMMPFGKWTAMWDARGPYVVCGPWGAEIP